MLKREKREEIDRLLNEIRDWSIDVAGCGWDVAAPTEFASDLHKATGDKVKLEALRQVYFSNLQQRFKLTKARSEYIHSISLSIFEDPIKTQTLSKFIEAINRQLEAVIFAIDKRLLTPYDNDLAMEFKKLSDDSKETARNLTKYVGSLKCEILPKQ